MTSKVNQSVGRQTQFLSPSQKHQYHHELNNVDCEHPRMSSLPRHSCVHQYQMTKPFYNCPRCYYWNQRSDFKMHDKRKSTTTCRDPNLILVQRARMQQKREEKQRRAQSMRNHQMKIQMNNKNQQQQYNKPPSEIVSPSNQNNSQRIDMINEYNRSHVPQSQSVKMTPKKQAPPESYLRERSVVDLNKFNPTSSLKPPNRLVLNKYPGGIKTKYMEDYPAHLGSMPQTEKIERKSLLHQPFQHKLETQTLKNIDYQGRQSNNLGKVKHQENLKVDHDIPFFGGTSYQNGFLNWGSAGSPPPAKPQMHQINLPLNARTSYGDTYKQADNFTRVKPTIDRNACSGIFPKSNFVGETTKNRDFIRFNNVEKTASWKPYQMTQTGLKGIFDTTHKSSFQTYSVGGKQKVDQNTLKAPIF